ncbi:pyridoxal phosphate-dependent aminotransferase [Flexibacterium corallicola]|uniref:pyridoxal phosphate-dependent aminotransferase n=1 Tax=Flexibacterium corallicola TaxID=3037259 RepID=UPI00286EE76B|nr:pyridoxal phosphate-dependent aminotransferase [Pseudovibrio sp. M1P-2-3]
MSVSRLKDIPGIGVDRMGNAADALNNSEILRLENLDTDFSPPPEAIEATIAAVTSDSANSYLPFLGDKTLRQAVSARMKALTGVSYDWQSQTLISAGGLSGVLNVLLATLEPGDEVIVTDPVYGGLLNRIRLAGGVPRFAPLTVVDGEWRLDLERFQDAISPRTKAILTLSPSMPTGFVMNTLEWQAVEQACAETGAWIIHDAAMERIVFDDLPLIHPASMEGLRERTISIGSVSKEYRMIGWRVGWITGPTEIIHDVGLACLSNVVCQVGIAMPAATAALNSKNDGVQAAIREWQRRRNFLLEELHDLPVVRPQGGWSLLIDTKALGIAPKEASRLLLQRGQVAATAMTGWGTEEIAGRYLRFVYSNESVERLKDIRERIRVSWSL